jgi:hypothetical protein
MISAGRETLNTRKSMQSFGIGSNASDVIGVGTGETVPMERETRSFLDRINESDLLRMKRDKRIASKGKARENPHGITK